MTMTDGEIVASYRQAAHPRKQIQILAELNNCGPDKIKNILRAAGCDLAQRKAKEAASDPAPKGEKKMTENLYALAIDTIAELLAQTSAKTEDAMYDFTEQVRGVLALIHTIEKEEEE